MKGVRRILVGVTLVAGGVLASLGAGGCSRELPRGTPDDTIASARATIERGRADRLHDFIYVAPDANQEDMKRLLARTGRLLGNVQKLGDSVRAKFPDDVAALKAQAEQAAASGKATSLLAQMGPALGGGRRRPSAAQQEQAREALDGALKRLFADPYAFLRESEGKLTTIPLTDTSAVLQWEGKPVMPPIGMTMQKGDDGRWYFVLPTNLPGLSSVMPKNKDQFQILGGLVQVIDNVAIDLRRDLDAGRVQSMDELARRAGEKLFIPAAIAFYAYGKYEMSLRESKENGTDATAPKVDARRDDGNVKVDVKLGPG